MAQTDFTVPALKQQVHSAVGVHTTPLVELVSNAEAAIDVKYNDSLALYISAKLAFSEALTLLDASVLKRRALAAVDNPMTAAVAPNSLLDQHMGKSIASAFSSAVATIVEHEVQPCVQTTLDKIFVSYRECVIVKRKQAEADLRMSFLAHWASATVDFQDDITNTTLASIETLNAALRSAQTQFERKRNSVVDAIMKACWTTSPPTPVPCTPSRTSLETMADKATPVGATKVAWADSQARRHLTPPMDVPAPTSSTPAFTHPPALPRFPTRDATWDHNPHGGAHPGHLDPPQSGGAPPDDTSPPSFTSGSRERNGTARYGGAYADHNLPYHPSGNHDGRPGPSSTGSSTHSPIPPSDDTCSEFSKLYHCGPYGLDEWVPLSKGFLHSVGFTNAAAYSEIMRLY